MGSDGVLESRDPAASIASSCRLKRVSYRQENCETIIEVEFKKILLKQKLETYKKPIEKTLQNLS
jgi:hypothetical protein